MHNKVGRPNKVYNTGKPTKGFDWDIIKKDGTKRYIAASASLQKDSSGKPKGFIVIVRDITMSKRVEKALWESEERYKTIFSDNLEPMSIVNKGIIVDVNTAWLTLHGCADRANAVGRDIIEFICPGDRNTIKGGDR